MAELKFKEEVFQIIGAAMEVYNHLGNGFLEAVYQEAFALEMTGRSIPFQEQVALNLFYKGQMLKNFYIADMLAYDQIIIEIKAIHSLGNNEDAQLLNYLKLSQKPMGVLINFGAKTKLEWKRMIN